MSVQEKRKADRVGAGIFCTECCQCQFLQSSTKPNSFKLLASFFDFKEKHTYRTSNAGTAQSTVRHYFCTGYSLSPINPLIISSISSCQVAHFVRCSPGDVQHLSHYELDAASWLLPSNSSTDSARECIVHCAARPMGLPAIGNGLPQKNQFQKVQLKNSLSLLLKKPGAPS